MPYTYSFEDRTVDLLFGFNANDAIGTFKAPVGSDMVSGSLVEIDTSNPGYIKLSSDNAEYTYILFTNVEVGGMSRESDYQGWVENVASDGDPITIYLVSKGCQVATDLIASGADTGAIDDTTVEGTQLSWFGGKYRVAQTGDKAIAQVIKSLDSITGKIEIQFIEPVTV